MIAGAIGDLNELIGEGDLRSSDKGLLNNRGDLNHSGLGGLLGRLLGGDFLF